PNRSRVSKGTQGAGVGKTKVKHPTVLEFNLPLMTEVLKFAFYVYHIPHEPDHHVQKVGELCIEGASIKVLRPMPASRCVISVIPVPEAMDGNHEYPPQDFLVQ